MVWYGMVNVDLGYIALLSRKSLIQQYAYFREYDSRRAGQQGPKRTLTAALNVIREMRSGGCLS